MGGKLHLNPVFLELFLGEAKFIVGGLQIDSLLLQSTCAPLNLGDGLLRIIGVIPTRHNSGYQSPDVSLAVGRDCQVAVL
jgi:hypothetical protein